ncbi:MAG: Methyltransferase domain protein [Syntrophorhabdus sp. PtaB.Bin047]|jgi:SAM-dependent methyltransferase|nr:MAG: Methyltransferase domain protein [Syntrophorhabdus sp. PtaB.Bin047]
MRRTDVREGNAGVIGSYRDHDLHARVGTIIREHSENARDIRSVVRDAVPWPGVRSILDLGCGYGWFEEVMPGGLDLIVGIDCLPENEAPFLANASARAREAAFRVMTLPAPTGLPADHFDLVLSLYSLYFFPGAVGEIARVLKPGGSFLSLTHSASMLEEGQHYFDFRNLRKVIERFSAENGEAFLRQHFTTVSHIDYPNALLFREGDEDSLALYIDFKREFIEKDVDPRIVRDKMLSELRRKGELRFNKNDRIFMAGK